MALKTVGTNRTELADIDLGLIERFNTAQQKRYDDVNNLMGKQMEIIAQDDTLDQGAKEAALQEQRNAYSNLINRYQGNLAAGTGDFIQQAVKNTAHTFNSLNKLQKTEFAAERKLAGDYGDRAIVLSDVGSQRLYDPAKGFMGMQDQGRLKADVRQASDYIAQALEVTKAVQPSYKDGQSPVYRIPSLGVIANKKIEDFTEEDAVKFANDEAVRAAFMANTTAKIDNRGAVGYDPATGTNKFTRRSVDARFKDGAAETIYAALKQRILRQGDRNIMSDPMAVIAARAGAGREEARRQLAATTRTLIDTTPEQEQQQRTSMFGTDGKLKPVSATLPTREVSTREGAFVNLGSSLSGASIKKRQQEEYDKAQREFTAFRNLYPEHKDKTDAQIWDLQRKIDKSLSGGARTILSPGEGYRTRVGQNLASGLQRAKVSLGNRTFNLGNSEQAAEFLESLGFNSWEEFNKANVNNNRLNVSEISYVAPKGSSVGSLPVGVQLLDSNRRPLQSYFSNANEPRKAAKHLDNVYQNLSASRTVATPEFDVTGSPTGTILTTEADLVGDQAIPHTIRTRSGSGVRARDILSRAKTYSAQNKVPMDEAVKAVSNGEASYLTWEQVNEQLISRAVYDVADRYAEQGATTRESDQEEQVDQDVNNWQ